ncbi:LuxR family transcriptional regulator [Actinoplanes cyaneus]|uniref:LuxR family transcriptional regulator n=1 Tax=Actinoplanes cyaneus TaxID=52696 RepID=A0A919M8B2_9ACTN|nr:LuxR family transcriptional regulator [Actinoplanes cyaneus]MCW2141720.1 regulatory protein, luxR family [Actinoplanes cyaneus]GID68198.1 LuxR family transcriptional regulator [Actinoplanes cyaneus]
MRSTPSGLSSDSADPAECGQLIGREQELRLIRDLIAGSATGGSLLFAGAAGIGRTTIVQAAVRLANRAGLTVLPATGAEFESTISFAGLHQILLPVWTDVAGLSPLHRHAMEATIGSGDGPPPDAALLVDATRTLLLRLAQRQGVAVVIDDLQWMDQASIAVLTALADDLAGTGITYLATVNTDSPAREAELHSIPARRLHPLSEQAAGRLLELRHPGLGSEVRWRLLAEAQGNPLAIVELPLSLDESQRRSARALPPDLPLTWRLKAVFEPRLAPLPEATRRLLLMTALDGSLPLSVLAEGPSELTTQDVLPADAANLAVVNTDGRISFRHPLVRTAVLTMSTVRERRRAHLELSEVLSGRDDQLERYAWHLAQAATEADEATACRLENTAQALAHQGRASAAMALLSRAAQLSPLAVDRTRRNAAAAYLGSEQTGDVLHVSGLLEEARRNDPDFHDSLVAATAAASILLLRDGDVDAAHALLVNAIERYDRRTDPHDEPLLEAIHTLTMVCVLGGRAYLWKAYHSAVQRLGPRPPRALMVSAQPDSARVSPDVSDALSPAIAALAGEQRPGPVVRTAAAAYHFDRIGDCSTAMRRVIADGRSAGNIASAISCMVLLAVDDWLSGQWSRCKSRALETLDLSVAHGYEPFAASCRYQLGLIAAARGDDETVQEITHQVARWAVPRGAMLAWSYTAQISTLAAIAHGNFEQAYQHAITISPAGRLDSHARLAPLVIMDLVESAVRTDRLAQAQAHVIAIKACDLGALSPRMRMLQLACEALVADDEDAGALYELALSVQDNHSWPFDLARVKLAYGSYLRRRRMSAAARPWLTQARDLFDELEATPFAVRAERELLAAGAKRMMPEIATGQLTAQELEVAQLAAAGLTNKEIAERLSISARTVSTHLYKIYPKLRINNRAGLRAALALQSDTED